MTQAKLLRSNRRPLYRITLTGKSYFSLGINEFKAEKNSLEMGDVVVFCIRRKTTKKIDHVHCLLRGHIYDGNRLRQLYLWTFVDKSCLFVKNIKKDDLSLVLKNYKIIANAILINKGNDTLYSGGYHRKSSECHRCGYCCIQCGVTIVRPEHINNFDGKTISSKSLIFKETNVPCPHLAWDDKNKSICLIHHCDWFQDTPCAKHKWNGSPIQCIMWKHVSMIKKSGSENWYTQYYHPYDMNDYASHFYEINNIASKNIHLVLLNLLKQTNSIP